MHAAVPFAFLIIPDEDAGVTTVYTAYECETLESQKRPNSLLDALERGERCSRPAAPEVSSQPLFFWLKCQTKSCVLNKDICDVFKTEIASFSTL